MFDPKDVKRIPAKWLFLICAAIGAICFIGIYGTRVLDFTNTAWLFDNDHDLRQHYIAWCRFRTDPWQFPIGLVESLSYPDSMSVIYTDSIPLFAVIFKIIGPALPVTFQYFGLFGILSFALMGGLSAILLRRFITSDACIIAGSVFYIISAPVLQRMYYHTALAAQWIIIAALVLWVYDDLFKSEATKMICWAIMGFLCVGIHSYFVPIVGMVLAADMITKLVKDKSIYLPAAWFMFFCAAGLANLWILGAFYGDTSAVGEGLGTFVANLNTFINPWEIGTLLPRLPLYNDFQYEGMAYLGAGILMLYVIIAIGLVVRRIRKVPEEAFHSKKVYGIVSAGLVLVSFAAAVLPYVCYNDILIVNLPYPRRIEKVISIFRSNGRLIWPAMYVLMTAAISIAVYTFRHYKVAFILTLAALLVQIVDMSAYFKSRYELYTSAHEISTMWDSEEMTAFVEGQREFIFLYPDNDITMSTAYYGYLHNMRQNNYYFARDIEDRVKARIDQYFAELDRGNLRDGAVYVIRQEAYEENRDYYDALPAQFIEGSGHVAFKAKK